MNIFFFSPLFFFNLALRSREMDSFEMSSESEDALDEIVISSSSFDFMHPPSSSPIHFCDNSIQSDDNSVSPSAVSSIQQPLRTLSGDGQENIAASTSNQLTTDSCTSKNSKSRRMEYSMRGMKMSTSNKSSQDSAFGSMTDGELSIASSSMRMNSFQSISSPIDEGVEDSLTGMPGPAFSRASTLNNENEPPSNVCAIAQSASDLSLSKQKQMKTANSSLSGSCITIEPPTILVNDGNSSFYTTSPSKISSTVEVFSQKYRVSSFEDMSNKRTLLKSVHKQNFRSLEEEQRIDSAFTPIGRHQHHRSFDTNRPAINNAEKFKKLTHVAFARKISSTKERHMMWKNSILSRKHNLIKSNESLNDSNKMVNYFSVASDIRSCSNNSNYESTMPSSSKLHKRVSSTSELRSTTKTSETDRNNYQIENDFRSYPIKSSSERYLLNLSTLKQSTIGDYEEGEEDEANAIRLSEVECFIDETSSSSGYTNTNGSGEIVSGSGSSDSSPSHRSMCKIMRNIDNDAKCIDENVPLLDGMEMSPISPVDTDEVL